MVDGRESVTTYKEFVCAMVDLRWLMTKDGHKRTSWGLTKVAQKATKKAVKAA